MGVHQREGGVVADRADVAEVIGEALELGHQRAQPDRARRRLDAERRLDGAGEGERIGDRAVAGDAAGEPRRPVDVGAGHQTLDALVDVAEPLLEPHHGLAVGGEAEMAGLDDAGMDRPDRDLVQALALGGQEAIGARAAGRRRSRAERMAARPSGRGRARAAGRRSPSGSSPKRSRIARSRRIAGGCSSPTDGKRPSGQSRLSDGDARRAARRAAPCGPCAPSPHRPSSVALAVREHADRVAPRRSRRDDRARPRPMAFDRRPFAISGSSSAIVAISPAARRRAGTRRPAAAAGRCRRPAPARDARTSARRRP